MKPKKINIEERRWNFEREFLLLVIAVDPKNPLNAPSVGIIYTDNIKRGIMTLRKAGAISMGSVILTAEDFSEADADPNGIVFFKRMEATERLLKKIDKSKSKSFASFFKNCEIYSKKDLVLLLVELDILLNPERYPGLLPYKPDATTLIDSYAASRELLDELNRHRNDLIRNTYLYIKKEDIGILEEPTEEPQTTEEMVKSKKYHTPSLREFREAYDQGVESLCQFIEELRDEALMSEVVLRLYELGMTNKEVKNFYKYYYTIWKGGIL